MLELIKNPGQLHDMTDEELAMLANETRAKIISTVSHNGGHLAPSLGVVELTLALLAEFDLDQDRLIWDVGHQSYAYKLLTGRAPIFDTLRKKDGLSGFPKMTESPYDHFGVGHASTSISAALGMAMARDLNKQNHHVIAVIGDGALTGGEALEGLNLVGHMGKRLIVILNDNEMSISTNVGALSLFLSRALSSRWARQTRREGLKFLRSIPHIGNKLALYAMRGEWSFKSFFTPGMLFESFRFTYIGPIDGHDIPALRRDLQNAAGVEDGPVLVHVRTIKGKGYEPAETNPTLFHGVGHFSEETGKPLKKSAKPSYTKIFGETITKLAENDEKIIAITAAMPEGTGTNLFRERFPDRFVDTGICEQHSVTFAAGLASRGFKPIVAIYSTFLQRAYDQIIHDVALQKLPVVFCIDRAGLVGEDGATHHGMFDMAYLRQIPNMNIIVPRDENMLRHCVNTALSLNAPCAVRYPRGEGIGVDCSSDLNLLPQALGEILKYGDDLAIIAAGSMVHPALHASAILKEQHNITCMVFDPIWIKPLPKTQLTEIAKKFNYILMVEEGCEAGGLSSAILEFFVDEKIMQGQKIKRMGLPDMFISHGTQQELRNQVGLTAEGIARAGMELFTQDREN